MLFNSIVLFYCATRFITELGLIPKMQKKPSGVKDYSKIHIEEPAFMKYEKRYVSYTESIGSAILYGLCSTSMAFLNKTVVSSFNFDYPIFIMACQMIICIVFLESIRICRVLNIPRYTIQLGISFLWPSLFYALHSITSLHALEGMSIPMYAAVKRCSPIVTLILSVILLQKKIPSSKLILSVVCITTGCLLAGLGDLKFDPRAYKYGVVCVLAQGLYLTLAQKSLQSMSAIIVLYISSYNTVLIFVLLSLFFEAEGITKFTGFSDPAFLLCFALQTVVGVMLNYSLFYCTEKNSALTTSLVGVVKSILQTVIGAFTFGGMDFNLFNIIGINMNLSGGILYTYLKYKEKINASKALNSESIA